MTSTTSPTVSVNPIRNGVDTGQMYGTLDAIKATPELAAFRFRARNRWLGGAHNRSTIQDFYGAGGEDYDKQARGRDESHERSPAHPFYTGSWRPAKLAQAGQRPL